MKRFKITFAFWKAEPGNLNPATSVHQTAKVGSGTCQNWGGEIITRQGLSPSLFSVADGH